MRDAKKRKAPRDETFEEQYAEMLRVMRDAGWDVSTPDHSESLEQPSPLRIVETVTTYGAYEKPL
jgi:hypothetical protein